MFLLFLRIFTHTSYEKEYENKLGDARWAYIVTMFVYLASYLLKKLGDVYCSIRGKTKIYSIRQSFISANITSLPVI